MLTVWPYAAERLTVKVAAVVPVLPSVTVTSLMVIEGASSAGQIPSFSRAETLLEPELADATSTRPSPLKSPTATPTGHVPVTVFTGGRKKPVPGPSTNLPA